jgi:hypothetical protein
MADYPVGINVGQKVNWRFGNLASVTEGFTIPNTSPGTLVRFPLSEYPYLDEPSNFVVAGFTEVTTVPASPTEFRVLYDYAHIEFYQSASPVDVTVQYSGNGSIIKAEDFNKAVDAVSHLAQLKMFNAVPISGGNFTFTVSTNNISVDTAISFIFPVDVFASFAGLDDIIPTFAVPSGSYTIEDGRFMAAVIKDDGTVTLYFNITLASMVGYAATSVVCPLFYRNGNSAIALWGGVAIGSGQSIGPNSGAEGGGLDLQAVTDNGASTTNPIIVGELRSLTEVIVEGNIVLERTGVDTWSAVIDTEELSTNLTYLLPNYDPLTEGPVLALKTDVTLDKVLANGNVTTEPLTVGGLYSTGDIEVDGDLIINGPILGASLTSGTYTPTITILTNIESSSPTPSVVGTFKYMRIGDMVHVMGKVSLRPSLFASLAEFNLTLPIVMDANFSSITQAAGVLTCSIEAQTGVVASNNGAQTVKCSFQTSRDYESVEPPPNPVTIEVGVSFMHEVIPA